MFLMPLMGSEINKNMKLETCLGEFVHSCVNNQWLTTCSSSVVACPNQCFLSTLHFVTGLPATLRSSSRLQRYWGLRAIFSCIYCSQNVGFWSYVLWEVVNFKVLPGASVTLSIPFLLTSTGRTEVRQLHLKCSHLAGMWEVVESQSGNVSRGKFYGEDLSQRHYNAIANY